MNWISTSEQLPNNNDRVIAFIPNNKVYSPGNLAEVHEIPVVILKFLENYFPESRVPKNNEGRHFWAGEGQSNHFFQDVKYWMPLPEHPN